MRKIKSIKIQYITVLMEIYHDISKEYYILPIDDMFFVLGVNNFLGI